MADSKQSLSILVSLFNEEEALEAFHARTTKVLDAIDIDYEIIFVNDGSTDRSQNILEDLAARDARVKVIAFSRNFGKEAAMTAAIDFATGDAAVPIDADLQEPPELIASMVEMWRSGADVVVAKRSSRESDSAAKQVTARVFYAIFNKVSELNIPRDSGDFRLMDRKVLDVIRSLPEKERFMKGLYCWPGFRTETIEFERQQRELGQTKFNYWGLWNFALSGITSFSTFPIRVSAYVGFFISMVAFLYGFIIILKTLLFGVDAPGYASIMVVILFLGGIQLIFLGVLGEYVGRVYKEVKNRPVYVVAKTIGFKRQD